MKKPIATITCEVATLWKEGQFADSVNTLKAYVSSEIAKELEEIRKEIEDLDCYSRGDEASGYDWGKNDAARIVENKQDEL